MKRRGRPLIAILPTALLLTAASPMPACAAEGIERIHLLVFSHTDIGFTHAPDTVARRARDSLDHAIDLCLAEPSFRWNVETVWQYRQWRSRTRDAERLAALRRLVREGRIAIGAAWTNMHSGLLGPEEACRLFYPAREVAEELGVELPCAFQDDVPGYTGDYPQLFARSGVRYLVAGVNLFIGGGAAIPAPANPFAWRGRDGSRITVWLAREGYIEAAKWGLGVWSRPGEAEEKIPERVRALEEAGYARADLLLLGSLGDNTDARAALAVLRHVRRWNARGARPRILFSTPARFFRTLGERALPVYEGDWDGHWELVKTGSPAGLALTRRAKRLAREAEIFGSIAAILSSGPAAGARGSRLLWRYRFPSEDLRGLYEDLLHYDGHTAGAGTGWPKLRDKDDTDRANEIHFAVARRAEAAASDLRRGAFDALVERLDLRGPEIVVFNASSWGRTDRVEARLDGPAPRRIIDAGTGEAVPFATRARPERIVFVARDVPPVGIRRYRLEGRAEAGEEGTDREEGSARPQRAGDARKIRVRFAGRVLASGKARVEVGEDGRIGSIRLADRECVRPGFGALSVGRIFRGFREVPCGRARVTGGGGTVEGWIAIERPDAPLARVEIRLAAGLDRVDLAFTLDLDRLPDPEEGSVRYALRFPFALRGALRFEGPLSLHGAGERLPGSRPLVVAARGGLAIEGPEGGVLLATPDAPIFLAPRPEAAVDALTAILYSHGVEGETRDRGRVRFERIEPAAGSRRRFRFRLHALPAGAGPVAIHRLLRAGSLPAVTVRPWGRQEGPIREAARSFLSIDPPHLVLQAFRPAAFGDRGDWILRLREIGGEGGEARIRWPWPRVRSERAGLTEAPIEGGEGDLRFAPHEVVTLRARPEDR